MDRAPRPCPGRPRLPLRTRAAAAIVLLYAQPASRIVRLTVDDVTCEDGEVFLRLGDPPSPVPGILLSWVRSRTNMRTATNGDLLRPQSG